MTAILERVDTGTGITDTLGDDPSSAFTGGALIDFDAGVSWEGIEGVHGVGMMFDPTNEGSGDDAAPVEDEVEKVVGEPDAAPDEPKAPDADPTDEPDVKPPAEDAEEEGGTGSN